jgi:two-component system sensor histidine kinase KdpD
VTDDGCVTALRVLGHELRRPLTVIRGASTLLVDDADALPPASRRQMLAMIDRSAASMSDMVDDLLTAVHLDLGDLDYQAEPLDLQALVEDAVEAASHEGPDRTVDVSGTEGLEVEADRQHVVQAVRALVVNALRFSPPGTAVEVVAGCQDDTVLVRVLDRGPGIPAEQRERAFEKFARLDPNSGGAGLGLFLARGLARGMGGEVTLADRDDGGTAVCITLKRCG